MVEITAQNLLGGHVAGRAHGEACGRQPRVLVGAAGQAEIGEQCAAVAVDEDVVGLEVAVDDPRVVGVLEAFADFAQIAP